MKTYTIDDIRDLDPCYDPGHYLLEDWQGTVLDILDVKQCPALDRIWVVLHFIDEPTVRLFMVGCVRQALAILGDPDPSTIHACDVAERYVHGTATQNDLDDLLATIWAADKGTGWNPKRAITWAAAGTVARAGSDKDFAAAAWDIARMCALAAAESHLITDDTVRYNAVAYRAAEKAQVDHLRKMLSP